jgi:hypothetical protein
MGKLACALSCLQGQVEALQPSADRLTKLEDAFDLLQFNSVKSALQGRSAESFLKLEYAISI